MARPSNTPRLKRTDPDDFARRVVQLAAARTTLEKPADPSDVPLGADAARTASYARGDSPADESTAQRLRRVCLGVYGVGSPEDAPAKLDSVVGVVVLAARARLKLDASPRRPVSTSEFAAYASIDASTARRWMRDKSLVRISEGLIDPASAIRRARRAEAPADAA